MATAAKFAGAEREKLFAQLEVPFDPAQIKWRVMRTSDDRRSGAILPFADPRAYTDRLNQLFTPAGWTREYTISTVPSLTRMDRGKVIVTSKLLVATAVTISRLGSHTGTGEEWADRENAVTAADARDGKTAVAVAFARAAALGGKKVVIIDADLRRPVTAVTMGLAPALRGIIEVLRRQTALSTALLMDPRSNAFVLSCARPVRDAAPVWSSPQFAQLVAHLRKNCDLVIIDAPVAQSPDMPLLAAAADGVVMVVARNRAHEPGVASAVFAMAQLPTPMGIALAG